MKQRRIDTKRDNYRGTAVEIETNGDGNREEYRGVQIYRY